MRPKPPVRLAHSLALLATSATLAAAPAAAQTPADAAISRGVALRREGRDEAALRVFQLAWRTSGAPRALAQVALAEQALGQWVDAEAHLVEALALRDPWVLAHLPVLQSALAEIRLHVGRLDVGGGPPDAEVVIDGAVVGSLPLAAMLHVPTGSLTFTVRREGYIPVTRTVQVDARFPLRERVTLALALAAPVAPVAPVAPIVADAPPPVARGAAPEPRPTTLRYVGYALLGTGVAALAVSGAFLGVNLVSAASAGSATPASEDPYGAWARFQASEHATQQSTGRGHCALAQQRGSADAAQVRDLCARMSTSATVALSAGIAGGALLVTGVLLAVAGRSRAPGSASRWALAPWIAANTHGASLSGTW
jgi:hypothetical protein